MVRCAIIAATVLGLGSATSADFIEYNFFLSGDQEVPPVATDAVGAAQLVYDTDTQHFDLDLMIFGIGLADLADTGPNGTPVHIHNAPFGANGSIVIDIGVLGSFFDDGLGIRLQITDQLFGGQTGNVFSDPNDMQAALFAGELYVNVHTVDHPGGELRGQIVPAPAGVLAIGLGGLVASRRRR